MSTFSLQWKVEKANDGMIVREFLQQQEISRAALTDIKFSGGEITVNGENVTVRRQLKEGEVLRVVFPPEQKSESMAGENIPLEIVYEDSYVLVLHKPAGMNTIPSREYPTGSLANGIIGYYEQIQHLATVHIVTRLDRDTSGLVLVAKHRHVHHLFSKMQRLGQIERLYEAYAEGVFFEAKGKIEKPIGRKRDSIIEREVQLEGQYACTHYEIVMQYETFAHVKLRLETGRTHQIRVHLSYLGHPLVGDDLYGGHLTKMERQALHCSELSFLHPISKERLCFKAPIPKDMLKVLESDQSKV